MARQKIARKTSSPRGITDITGILLASFSALLLVALLSYDPHDLSFTGTAPNAIANNWIGRFGAWLAHVHFFVFGAAAFLIPVLIACLGLSYLFQFLHYFKRQLVWAVILLFCVMGGLDLYNDWGILARFTQNINAPSAGGILGLNLNERFFGYFGLIGASIVYFTIYLISLLYLTNFHLIEWIRRWWEARKTIMDELRASEKQLAKQAKELRKEADELEQKMLKEQPEPEPVDLPDITIRDHSIPRVSENSPENPEESEPVAEEAALSSIEEEQELVISSRELEAATAEDVLGEASFEETDEPLPSADVEEDPLPLPRTPKPKRKRKPIAVAATPVIGDYKLPPLDLLNGPDPDIVPTDSRESLMANARLMQNTLAQFGIEVALGDITKGPTITRYELHPAPGVKLERITALTNNIAAALKAERIHVLAPVPGKSSVGVEVPNLVKTKVILRELLEAKEWRRNRCRIPIPLGKDVYGHAIIVDLADMPHLLIAGSTGSGKSVCINGVIASLLYRFTPDQLRFVMIDPKVVELQQYNHLPHLVVPVVTDPKKVVLALRWVINEMEKRYQIFAKVGVRNIRSFNDRPKDEPVPEPEPELPLTSTKESVEAGAEGFAVEVDEEIVVPREDDILIPERLSYIVVIIDELADLMLVAGKEVEGAIARITQMARAAGIHVIVATQRPSVDVITGVIKANIPARIAFQVASRIDSRTILDAMGADKLLGKGDMLYLPPGSARFTRAQGMLITDEEINRVVEFITRQGKPSYEMEIHEQLSKAPSSFENSGGIDEDEELIEQCIDIIRMEHKASVSMLQRRLRLGYTRAARIMDELENRGIVGPSRGAEPREILIDLDGTGADGRGQ